MIFTVLICTSPNRKWRTPVAFTGKRPVFNITNEISKTSLLQMFRIPINVVIISNKRFLNICHCDKPRFHCIIYQWRLTSPTKRVIMSIFMNAFYKFSFFKMLNNFWISIFNKLTFPKWNFRWKSTIEFYKLYYWKIIFHSNIIVILTKCRCDVNNPCSIFHCYKICENYIPCFFLNFYKIKQWFVFDFF